MYMYCIIYTCIYTCTCTIYIYMYYSTCTIYTCTCTCTIHCTLHDQFVELDYLNRNSL